MPMKPLTFKGDKSRPKKRKHRDPGADPSSSTTITTASTAPASTVDDEDDTWLHPDTPSDLTGPTLLVLPTSPPTCLASDAHGNIYASALENIIDGNATTAEPHDVRQVWVASRVAGMNEGEVSFKGSHGGYLSCDSYGVLGARREARGIEEGFVVISAADTTGDGDGAGKWKVKTAASKKGENKYLCAVVDSNTGTTRGGDEDSSKAKKKISIALRGDGDENGGGTLLIVKMQARFKPKVQRDKEQKKSEKVSRAELERVVGRRLEDDEVRRLKRAKRDGTYHEEILDVRVKGKHDKFA